MQYTTHHHVSMWDPKVLNIFFYDNIAEVHMVTGSH